jgi:sec-independent protein translocase protein TatC
MTSDSHVRGGEEDRSGDERKTFMEHLLELRARIFVCLFFILAATVASWVFWKQLAIVIRMPVDIYNATLPPDRKVELIITAPMEAFNAVLQLGLWAGLVLSSPVILWEVWKFVAPGLYRREKFALLPILMLGPFLFAAGAYFAFRYVIPVAMQYLLSFAPEIDVLAMLTLSHYMRFFVMIHIAFGLSFETPLMILALARFGLVTPRGLLRAWRYVIVGAIVLGAILTPPDVITQLMMAGVLLVLYGVSIVLAAVFGRRSSPPVADDAGDGDDTDDAKRAPSRDRD